MDTQVPLWEFLPVLGLLWEGGHEWDDNRVDVAAVYWSDGIPPIRQLRFDRLAIDAEVQGAGKKGEIWTMVVRAQGRWKAQWIVAFGPSPNLSGPQGFPAYHHPVLAVGLEKLPRAAGREKLAVEDDGVVPPQPGPAWKRLVALVGVVELTLPADELIKAVDRHAVEEPRGCSVNTAAVSLEYGVEGAELVGLPCQFPG